MVSMVSFDFNSKRVFSVFVGYGIADEFVDQNFCSEKCRKLSQSRPQTKSREGGAAAGKVAVKRKSTSSNSSSQAGDNNAVVESSLESSNETGNKDADSKVRLGQNKKNNFIKDFFLSVGKINVFMVLVEIS